MIVHANYKHVQASKWVVYFAKYLNKCKLLLAKSKVQVSDANIARYAKQTPQD